MPTVVSKVHLQNSTILEFKGQIRISAASAMKKSD
jgi:hypothetical protein